jgi:uncharacterized membrane-anchored protein
LALKPGIDILKPYFAIAFLAAPAATQADARSFHDMFGTDAPDGDDGAVLRTIDFKQGSIALPEANAKLNVTSEFYYLDPADTRKVLVQLWGNPESSADDTLGMIFPSKYPPTDERSWGSIVAYENTGYVSDSDAESTDYTDVLNQIQDAIKKDNPDREKQGFAPITLVGWASPPHYDKQTHALHWARDLIFGKDPATPHTLNYSVRALGREGVLEFDFVAGLNQLQEIDTAIPNVIKAVQYESGKTYSDHASGDKVAAYGMAGMIAAGAGVKLAAKLGFLALIGGFFSKILVGLLALKKGLILVVAGVAAVGRKFFGFFRRNKSTDA